MPDTLTPDMIVLGDKVLLKHIPPHLLHGATEFVVFIINKESLNWTKTTINQHRLSFEIIGECPHVIFKH
jgi:hypothetical protein